MTCWKYAILTLICIIAAGYGAEVGQATGPSHLPVIEQLYDDVPIWGSLSRNKRQRIFLYEASGAQSTMQLSLCDYLDPLAGHVNLGYSFKLEEGFDGALSTVSTGQVTNLESFGLANLHMQTEPGTAVYIIVSIDGDIAGDISFHLNSGNKGRS